MWNRSGLRGNSSGRELSYYCVQGRLNLATSQSVDTETTHCSQCRLHDKSHLCVAVIWTGIKDFEQQSHGTINFYCCFSKQHLFTTSRDQVALTDFEDASLLPPGRSKIRHSRRECSGRSNPPTSCSQTIMGSRSYSSPLTCLRGRIQLLCWHHSD